MPLDPEIGAVVLFPYPEVARCEDEPPSHSLGTGFDSVATRIPGQDANIDADGRARMRCDTSLTLFPLSSIPKTGEGVKPTAERF